MMKRIKRFSDEYFRAIAPACEEKLFSSGQDNEGLSPPHVFSDGFNDRMDDIFRMIGSPKRKLSPKAKIAIAVAAALILMLSAMMSVGAVRGKLYRIFFLSKSSSHATLQYIPWDEGEEPAPVVIEFLYLPTYVPEGFTVSQDRQCPLYCMTEYSRNGKYIQFDQHTLNSITTIDMESIKTETLEVNGYEVIFNTYEDSVVALWCNDEYELLLMGDISRDEALKMIESVKKTDIVPRNDWEDEADGE